MRPERESGGRVSGCGRFAGRDTSKSFFNKQESCVIEIPRFPNKSVQIVNVAGRSDELFFTFVRRRSVWVPVVITSIVAFFVKMLAVGTTIANVGDSERPPLEMVAAGSNLVGGQDAAGRRRSPRNIFNVPLR